MAEPVETDVGPASEEGEPQRHVRSEEHTSELQSQSNLVCRLLLEKKKTTLLYRMVNENANARNLLICSNFHFAILRSHKSHLTHWSFCRHIHFPCFRRSYRVLPRH